MSDKTKRYKSLFSDTAAFTISNFASKILVFLLVPLYTSVLSTEEYAIADLIINTINLLYPILTLSIMEATLRFAFDKGVSKDEVLNNSLLIILLSEMIVIAFTPLTGIIGDKYESVKALNTYWSWFAIIYLGFNLQQVFSQYIKGVGNTKVFAVSGVIQTIVVILTNIFGLIVFKWGLFAYLLSIALGYYLSVIYIIVFGRVRIRIYKINLGLLKEMLMFCTPMIPTLLSWWVSTSADKYILIACKGLAISGVYSVAYKIPSVLTLLSNIFTSAWTISVIKTASDEDKADYQSSVYKYYNCINILICTVFILLSQVLGKVLFAADFYEAWHCVPLLLVAYVFACLSGFLASSFRAEKNTKGLFSTAILGSIANIVLNFFFIPNWGMMGAAFTTIIGFGITFVLREKMLHNIIRLSNNDKRKNYIAYMLLLLQAIYMGNTSENYYILSLGIVILIFILFRNEYLAVLKKIIDTLKAIRKKID